MLSDTKPYSSPDHQLALFGSKKHEKGRSKGKFDLNDWTEYGKTEENLESLLRRLKIVSMEFIFFFLSLKCRIDLKEPTKDEQNNAKENLDFGT